MSTQILACMKNVQDVQDIFTPVVFGSYGLCFGTAIFVLGE